MELAGRGPARQRLAAEAGGAGRNRAATDTGDCCFDAELGASSTSSQTIDMCNEEECVSWQVERRL